MIIWLASYPKSGNTLVRSILASLIYTQDARKGVFLMKITLTQKVEIKLNFLIMVKKEIGKVFYLKNLH